MSKDNAACCGCGWTGRMEHSTDHISGCVKWAERDRDDPDDPCLDPALEWARRMREDGDADPLPPGPEQVARHRAEQIRKAGAWIVDTYAAAVLEEDWKALGYDDVAQWREAEFGVFRLLPQVRAEAAHLMLEGGQTVPDIAAATGVTERTIRDDVAAVALRSQAAIATEISPSASPPVTASDGSQVSEITVTPEDVTLPVKRRPGARQGKKEEKARAERDAELANRVREQAHYLSLAGLEDVTHEQVTAVAVEDIAKQVAAECVCPACGQEHARKDGGADD